LGVRRRSGDADAFADLSHVADFFELTGAETKAILAMLRRAKVDILNRDPSISAFNIGVNNGKDAGQTVFHVHFHRIPRRAGDVENPRGGVRGVFPGKANYRGRAVSTPT
jgi:ATP adenylyltransferase